MAGITQILLRRTPRRRSCNACGKQQLDDAYNVRQALISVGSGGLIGKGWRQGTQNALGYLPRAVAHNDFIFSVIAEEEGFVGSVIVFTLYAVVLFTGMRIAGQARDRLGKLVAVGVVTLIFSHVFINIGMNIRIMPVTGVPLPLLSYGGSSVLCSLIAMGMLQNIHIHRKDINYEQQQQLLAAPPRHALQAQRRPEPRPPETPTAKPSRRAPTSSANRAVPTACSRNATRSRSSAPKTSPPACRPRARPKPPRPTRRHAHPHEHKHEAAPAAPVRRRTFAPVKIPEQPKGLLETITTAAANIVKKVQRLISPEKKVHKEVIINAETLETRVAVTEDGKLEEFNIERTTEERLVGSIFKGNVRNLEDGLKAAFVDIGFEKNAFLHYWDIVPNQFDSGVEIVEREGRAAAANGPRSRRRTSRAFIRPAADIIVQVTKGPIGTKGPRVTTNLVLPGRYLVLLPNSDQSGISRKIENQRGAPAPQENPPRTPHPRRHGRHHAHRRRGPAAALLRARPRACCSRNGTRSRTASRSSRMATCVFQEPDLIERTVRDFLTEDVERIVVDSPKAHDRMREMISKISKRSASKIKLYTEAQPVFDRFNISKQLENTFSRQVHLKSGGYIVMDETEALVAIDVNTGRHKGGKDQEAAHPQSEPRGRRRNLPPVAPAQHGRPHRARLH